MNINLNFGGFLGAVSGVIIAGAIVFPQMTPGSHGPFGKILIGSALAGAYAGNALWSSMFRKKPANPQSEGQPADDQVKIQHRDAA